jgi:hypothetical protein
MREVSISSVSASVSTSVSAALVAAILAAAGGCKVADKQSTAPDGGTGGPGDGAPPDPTTPDTTIDDGPAAFSNTGQVTFQFSSKLAAATFECRLDKEVAQPCQSPYVRTLADGSHSFSVRAMSATGQGDDSPAERVWTIDTVAPETQLKKVPPIADNSVTAEFEFTASEDNVVFDCSLDNAGYQPCVSGTGFGPVGDGPHAFAVRARDRAGNGDASPAVYAWTVDTRTPDTQLINAPSGATASTSATITFFSPDAGAGATFQCALDGTPFIACDSPKAYGGLVEGTHTFSVRVRDSVGNLDPTPATRSWTVDLTPPDTSLMDGPNGTVPIASASFAFLASEPGSSFSCSLDGAAFAACTSPAAFTGLAQGAHSFAVRATDAAGHDDPTPATRAWAVDTVPPDIAIVSGPDGTAASGPRVIFGFTVSDGAVGCSLDGGDFAACATPFAKNLAAGAHQFAVRATDGAGNVETVTRGWTVACAPPGAIGAAGQLHLDGGDQAQPNAVAGGALATLGDTADAEITDPSPLAGARFAGGLSFAAGQGDRVAWPIGLAAAPELSIELWARPSAAPGTHDVLVSSDGRVALRVAAAGTAAQFSIAITDPGPGGAVHVASSAAVAAGAWHHVIASLQPPALRLWVDGARSEAGGLPAGAPAIDAVRIGGEVATGFDGDLDEVWIASSAIADDEAALTRYCPL